MEMGAGGAAGASTERDGLALIDGVSFLHQEFREVQVECEQALAVVDDNAVSFKEQRPRQNDFAAVDGGDLGSRPYAEIEP